MSNKGDRKVTESIVNKFNEQYNGFFVKQCWWNQKLMINELDNRELKKVDYER